jgi:hypothetical protein
MKIKLVKPTIQTATGVQLHAESQLTQREFQKQSLNTLHTSELSK